MTPQQHEARRLERLKQIAQEIQEREERDEIDDVRRHTPPGRPVLNIETLEMFPTIVAAANSIGISPHYLGVSLKRQSSGIAKHLRFATFEDSSRPELPTYVRRGNPNAMS